MVEPLEASSGRRLFNPQRQMCLAAFEQHPEAVRELARDAVEGRDPVALFVWRIKEGWHRPVAEAVETSLRSAAAG